MFRVKYKWDKNSSLIPFGIVLLHLDSRITWLEMQGKYIKIVMITQTIYTYLVYMIFSGGNYDRRGSIKYGS